MLKDISSPLDLKKLNITQLESLAGEIREELVHCVSETGGHLASNLGIVELTIALHYVYDCPEDKIVFDVGHQCYVHKMLTGRYLQMKTLRQKNGLSGFPDPAESKYDCFAAGHASNAISAALGIIRAGGNRHVVTVVGDGALNGGMCYEALNDAGQSEIPMVVILNDNEMSISKNVGAMSFYLDSLRRGSGYRKVKTGTKNILGRIPVVGTPILHGFERIRDSIKALFIKGTFFETLGFNYIGPVDGHDIKKLIRVLERIKDTKRPILLHVVTQKGKGYEPAENEPTGFHGVAPFYIETGIAKNSSSNLSFGEEACRMLTALAGSDKRICLVCAAMVTGTGMDLFKQTHRERFYDVGIAEEHAVTMAAGMASAGKHPYVAIYSTFLQRSYDQIMIDVCRNALPVTFLIDRAGLTGSDGRTHQGVYDISYLNSIPDMTITSARDTRAIKRLIRFSTQYMKPLAIRYSKQAIDLGPEMDKHEPVREGIWEELLSGNDVMILAEGPMVNVALQSAVRLSSEGISCGVTDAIFLKPLDESYLKGLIGQGVLVVTLEENVVNGGFGSAVDLYMNRQNFKGRIINLAVPDSYIKHATVDEQRKICHIDTESVINTVRKEFLGGINETKTR